MPTGEIRSVKGTIFDFNQMHTIRENIDADNRQIINGMGYDHNFVLDKNESYDSKIEHLSHIRWMRRFVPPMSYVGK